MEEELKRIRAKDYSAIDNRLMEDIVRADGLSDTLNHLSLFQHYLLERIGSLNGPIPAPQITTVIAQGFSHLRQSLIRCSRPVVDLRLILGLVKQLKEELDRLKYQATISIERGKEEGRKILLQMNRKLQQGRRRERQLTKQLYEQRNKRQEVKQLKKQLCEAFSERNQFKSQLQRHKKRMKEIESDAGKENLDLTIKLAPGVTKAAEGPSPHKLIRGASSQGLVRQRSNHSLAQKGKFMVDKESSYEDRQGEACLRAKGGEIEEGRRSKQKLKLFSVL